MCHKYSKQKILAVQSFLMCNNTVMATGGCEPDLPNWDTKQGKYAYGASGITEVLIIAPTFSDHSSEVVPRRPREELSEDERRKLEHQGIPRDCHHDDLSVMKARFSLDKEKQLSEVMAGDSLACELVRKQITCLMNNTDTTGVILYYIGPGKKGTGDWCFSDGFISFREIMDLYMSNNHFKGKLLYIYSDCSYSGSWVREAMAFLDEQGVGPCGHVAKEKGILIKVLASCLADEIPAELAFSTHGVHNDKNDGTLWFINNLRCDKVYERQCPSTIDFTRVYCKNKIDQPCTMAPGSTWQKWSAQKRAMTINGKDKGRPAWHYLLLVDDEETIRIFEDKTRGENAGKHTLDMNDFGKILKSGWGQDPTNVEQQWVEDHYFVNYNYQPSSHTAD